MRTSSQPSALLRPDALTVGCPAWEGRSGLIHGTTTRQALPEHGKADFFKALAQARQAGAIPPLMAVGADQVHEAHLEILNEPLEDRRLPPGFRCEEALQACEFPRTDALLTTLPGVLLIIQTADCLPVFLVDVENRIAGLAHCGWRGVRAGLAGILAREMVAQGAVAERLEAWLGPCICARNYEVGRELVADFEQAFPGAEVSTNGTHLDLPAVARWQLEEAGLRPELIFESGECTRGQMDRYHSYRGEAESAGRMFSFIGFQP